jgi:NRPS condensation-like uncharacterized protein
VRTPQRFPTEPFDRFLALLDRCEMAVVVELDGPLNVAQLSQAVQLLLDAIPLLRCRFVEHWWQPRWEEATDITGERIVSTHPDGDPEQRFFDLLTRPMDHPLQAVVRNGVCGTLTLKIDHRLADYRSLIQILYLLAEVYSQLERDPNYVLPKQPRFERGFCQITRIVTLRERLRLLQSLWRTARKSGRPGRWRLPDLPPTNLEFASVLHTFSSSEVEALESYGCSLRGTVFHVLLAAFFLAMVEVLGDSDALLPIMTSIDLRRYLRPDKPFPFGNLIGHEVLNLRRDRAATVATVVRDIQEQFVERRDASLGLGAGPAALDLMPLLRFLPGVIPFAWLRRWSRRWKARLAASRERPWIQAHQGGEFNSKRLRFGNLLPQRVFGCPGPVGLPGEYHFGATGFAGTVTAYWGCGPKAEMENLRSRVLSFLAPVLSAPAGR